MFANKKKKKTGYWIKVESVLKPVYYRCSVCGSMLLKPLPVCPVCGSQMKKGQKIDPVFIDEFSLME